MEPFEKVARRIKWRQQRESKISVFAELKGFKIIRDAIKDCVWLKRECDGRLFKFKSFDEVDHYLRGINYPFTLSELKENKRKIKNKK